MTQRLTVILILLSALLLPVVAHATTVQAQVKDANGTLYANCHGEATFRGQNTTPGAGPYLLGGVSVFQTVVPFFCDSSGNMLASVADNSQISPSPSQWNFSICSSGGAPPLCFNALITITGLLQNITAVLQPLAPLLPIGGGGGGSWNPPNPAAFPGTVNIPVGPLNNSGTSNLSPAVNISGFSAINLTPDPWCAVFQAGSQDSLCNWNGILVWNPVGPASSGYALLQVCQSDYQNTQQPPGGTIYAWSTSLLCFNQLSGATNTILSGGGVYKSLGDLTPTLYAGSAGGTAAAQTACPSPAVTALAAGLRVSMNPVTSTGPATLNLCTLGAKNVYKISSAAVGGISTGDLTNGVIADLLYDGTEFILIDPAQPAIVNPAATDDLAYYSNTGVVSGTANFAFNAGVTQLIVPAGTTTTPPITASGDATNTGWYFPTVTSICWVSTGTCEEFIYANGFAVASGNVYGWSSTTSGNGTKDTCLDRRAAGIVRLDSDSACSNDAGLLASGNTITQTGSDFTTTNTTATVWISFPAFPTGAQHWAYDCQISWQSSVNTAGLVLGIIDSAAPTFESGSATIYTNNNGAASTFTTGRNTGTSSASVTVLSGGNAAAATTVYEATLHGNIETTATAGTFSIEAWNTSAATLTIFRGSTCHIWGTQ